MFILDDDIEDMIDEYRFRIAGGADPTQDDDDVELLHRTLAQEHLSYFTNYTFKAYDLNWHHRILCDVLDSFTRRDIKRLMVFMPPRNGKSELVSRRLPAYIFGRDPNARIIACSYGAELAISMGKDVQSIMDSYHYRKLFPNSVLPGRGQGYRGANGFGLLGKRGTYRAAGVGGPITGYGFDYGIIDDPIKNRQAADSGGQREVMKAWYSSTFSTRQEKNAGILLTMTRWHEDDLCGWLLGMMDDSEFSENWEILSLPAISEEPMDPRDPREIGMPLWPNKYDLHQLMVMQNTMGERDWASLQQQRPSPRGGTTFQSEWYNGKNRFDSSSPAWGNACIGRFLSFDTAMKIGDNHDYTAYTVLEILPDYRVTTRKIEREKVIFPDLVRLIADTAVYWNQDGKLQGVLIEDKNSGTSAFQTLNASAPPWLRKILIPFMPNGKKETRAEQAAVWCRNGTVLLPEDEPWLQSFEAELFGFPSVVHDDRVDSLVQVILYLEHQLSAGYYKRMGWTATVQPGNMSNKETLLEMARQSRRVQRIRR